MEIRKNKIKKGSKWFTIYPGRNKQPDINKILSELKKDKKEKNIFVAMKKEKDILTIKLTPIESAYLRSFIETNIILLPAIFDFKTLIVTDTNGIVEDIENNDLLELKKYIESKYLFAVSIKFLNFDTVEITQE